MIGRRRQQQQHKWIRVQSKMKHKNWQIATFNSKYSTHDAGYIQCSHFFSFFSFLLLLSSSSSFLLTFALVYVSEYVLPLPLTLFLSGFLLLLLLSMDHMLTVHNHKLFMNFGSCCYKPLAMPCSRAFMFIRFSLRAIFLYWFCSFFFVALIKKNYNRNKQLTMK